MVATLQYPLRRPTPTEAMRRVMQLRKVFRRQADERSPVLQAIRQDPARILTLANLQPDPWQRALLRCSSDRVLMLASRQIGKSFTAGALALHEALTKPGSLVLLLSPSLRQSGELFRDKVLKLYAALGRPLEAESESALKLELANGSRIVSLPGKEATVRGFASVSMLVIDEAARVADSLYRAVRPMLAVTRGRLVVLSTAYAQQGFFFTEWTGPSQRWKRVHVKAWDCPRITHEFLQEELLSMGPRIFAREYEGVFCSADDAVFDFDSIQAAFKPGGPPPLY